jgi:hypothetical protein
MPLSKPIFSLLGLDLRYGFDMLKCMQTTKELREEVMRYGVYECKTLHECKMKSCTFCDSTWIFIQASNDCNVARA